MPTTIFTLTPGLSFAIVLSCVIAALAGAASVYLLLRQQEFKLDFNSLLGRRELALLYGIFVLERLVTALSFASADFLVANAGIKVMMATTVTLAAFAMYRRIMVTK